MPVPASINDLALTAIANSPQGTDSAKGSIDNYLRTHASFLAKHRDKLLEIFSVEDYFLAAEVDHTGSFTRAFAAIASAGSGCLRLFPGKAYSVSSRIDVFNRRMVIDGNNATITLTASATYALFIEGENCEVRNLVLNKAPAAVVTAAIYVKGNQHVFRNVTSLNQKWAAFFHCKEMKESHFSEIRVDMDTTTFLGDVFKMDFCVNNTVSDSMLGYCAQAFYGTSAAHPSFGYHNEGLLISNVVTVFAGKAVNMDNATFVAVSNCCFDFCETQGVFVSNGNTISVTNTWIASNVTNGFIGVGSLSAVANMSVIGCSLVRGASAISGSSGVSLPGENAIVIGNSLQSGMNGGAVTAATSQEFGNVVSGGGTVISSAATIAKFGGAMAVAGDVTIAGALTVSGNKGIYPTGLSGAATTGANGAPPAQVAGYASISIGGTAYKIPYYNV